MDQCSQSDGNITNATIPVLSSQMDTSERETKGRNGRRGRIWALLVDSSECRHDRWTLSCCVHATITSVCHFWEYSFISFFFFFFTASRYPGLSFPSCCLSCCLSLCLLVCLEPFLGLFAFMRRSLFYYRQSPPKQLYSLRGSNGFFSGLFLRVWVCQNRPGRFGEQIESVTYVCAAPWADLCPCFSSPFLSVPDHVQRRGSRPGPLCQPSVKLHHQQYLWRERGECVTLCVRAWLSSPRGAASSHTSSNSRAVLRQSSLLAVGFLRLPRNVLRVSVSC